jgi:EmrB/QacA subfamily drug resistance transporter
LATLSLAMLLPSLGAGVVNVALPTLTQAFSAPLQDVQWVLLAYLLAMTTLIVSAGRLGDTLGRRRVFLGGLMLFTAASALCGVTPTLGSLIICRMAQGLGGAALAGLTMAIAIDVVPRERTGSAMGLLATMSALGNTLGPSVGGILIATLGWRSIFLVNVPLGIVGLFLAYRYLPADRPVSSADGSRFDHAGTLLLAVILGAYALAMTVGHGRFDARNGALLAVAACGAGLFWLVESRAASPLVQLKLFREPRLAAGLSMSMLVTTVLMGMLIVGSFYLARDLGLGTGLVGAILSVGPLTTATIAVPAGRLSDRLGTKPVTIVGLIGIALGSLMFATLPLHVWVYICSFIVASAAYALFQTANTTEVMKDVAGGTRGVVSAMLNLARNLGVITGASAMAALYAVAGIGITFVIGAALMACALLIAVWSSLAVRERSPLCSPSES